MDVEMAKLASGETGIVRRPRGPAFRLMLCILACNMKTFEITFPNCNGDDNGPMTVTMNFC